MSHFTFRDFQLDDIARAACVDRLILAPEQGLGKTVEALAWALLKRPRATLIVAPEQLHRQWQREALEKFALTLTKLHPAHLRLTVSAPRFFITSYHALGVTAGGSLGRLAARAQFFDCVIADEGTRLQGADTLIGKALRRFRPRYRLIVSATPVKNRIGSLYWLLRWIYDGWPPHPALDSPRAFANYFLEQERGADGRRQASVHVCRIHELWRLLAPVVIRRRKVDCGEEIMPCTIKPLIVKPGAAQLAVYRWHLHNPPQRAANGAAVDPRVQAGIQLGLLRQAALCPSAPALAKSRADSVSMTKRSWTDLTPKHAALFNLIVSALNRGEQFLIGAPFRDFNEKLHQRLREAGVSSVLLDGSAAPDERAELAEGFKRQEFSVAVAGQKAMAEGLSFECCPNVALAACAWAFDENDQFIHRVWRLNSPLPVTAWLLITENTIEERMYKLYGEKHASSSLTLDAGLPAALTVEPGVAEVLHDATVSFNPAAPCLDEQKLERAWTAHTAPLLAQAELRFREFHPPVIPPLSFTGDIRRAIAALQQPSPTNLSVALSRARNLRRRRVMEKGSYD
jgi:SNF2 family DNA or RNA helicase